MTKTRQAAPLPLHPAFVSALRAAWEQQSRRLPALVGAIYWNTEDGRLHYAALREQKRLARLAVTLRYEGPLFADKRVA